MCLCFNGDQNPKLNGRDALEGVAAIRKRGLGSPLRCLWRWGVEQAGGWSTCGVDDAGSFPMLG